MKQKIILLLEAGKTYSEIQKEVGCSKATISYHAKKNGLRTQKSQYTDFPWHDVRAYYNTGASYRQCKEKFQFTSHMWGKAVKNGDVTPRGSKKQFHELKRRNNIKQRIIKENLLDYKCNLCGLTDKWNGKNLVLQLDHINGISYDHRLENLRFLCPNCHSQTSTYCRKNKGV